MATDGTTTATAPGSKRTKRNWHKIPPKNENEAKEKFVES